MAERLREFIREHELLKKGERVAVGFSGGPDSTCLLHLLIRLGYKVIALHLNHGQRPEAEEEERFCALRAKEWGVEFLSEKASVPDFAKRQGIGLEEAGRILRYQFFEKVSTKRGGIKVATAHTMDDSVETLLMNLARGTGMTGLTGIPLRRGIIIRPLLWARRHETQAYCEEHALPTLSDPTNVSLAFTRARVRRRLIPVWEKIHPQAVENAHRASRILAEENLLLEKLTDDFLAQCEKIPRVLSEIARRVERKFQAEKLREGNQALIRRAILQILKSLTSAPPLPLSSETLQASPTFEILNSVAQALQDHKQSAFTLPGGDIVIEVFPHSLRVRSLKPPVSFQETLRVPGAVISPEGLWRLRAKTSSLPPPGDLVGGESTGFPLQWVRGSLRVRPPLQGDRILLPGKREVSILKKWHELGLPASVRARLPVVEDEGGLLWAPGIGVTQRQAPPKKPVWLFLSIEACAEKPMV